MRLTMKIKDLYDKIYIFKASKVQKRKIYLTRNKVKKLRKMIPNDKIFKYIIDKIAVKISGQVPKGISDKLIKEFGLYVEHYNTSNSSAILLFW